MLRSALALAMILLVSTVAAADDRLEAKILYCGDPGSDRAKDYCAFLESHFVGPVVVQDLLTFEGAQAKDCDLVIFDWSNTYDADGGFNQDKWARVRKAPPLSANFHRPAILIGAAGGTVSQKLNLKIHWLCLCLNGPAYRVRTDHALFHSPLEVNPEIREQPTPADYPDLSLEPDLGTTMKVWQVQVKSFPEADPGLVSTLYGFADSPDAEVIAQGFAMKGPDTVALGRHANYFLWGFSAPPSEMTPSARRLFVNVVAYMRRFDGQSPLVRRTSPAREWALRYAAIPRSLNEESEKREAEQMREGLKSFSSALPAKYRDDPEAFIAERVKSGRVATLAWFKQVIPQPLFEQCGMDTDKYLAYYRENFEFLRTDPGEGKAFEVDEEAKVVGPSNRDPKILERCVAMLERNDRPELARSLLKRYTAEDFAEGGQWRAWLTANRSGLFFSDVGGYKFFVQSAVPSDRGAAPPSATAGELRQ